MFFKKNKMQQEIDSFKRMQNGLSAASLADRSEQRGTPMVLSAASVGASDAHDKVGEPMVKEPTSGGSDHQHSIVSGEATWEGKLRTDASVRIEGTISGEIEAGETVFIAKGSHARANVQARRVIVAGELEGQITCREQLVVEQSGRLEGKVSTKTIVILEGAVVQSQIQMLRGDEPAQTAARESIPWGDIVPSPLGKPGSQRSKPGQAGSLETKSIEL